MRTLADPAARAAILNRLGRLTPASQGAWGRMNVHQMICHLNDSFLLPLGRRNVSAASGFWRRTLMKWGALYFPAPWPRGTPTRPEVEQGAGGTPPTEFDADRRSLTQTIEAFCASPALASVEHPIFGPMSSPQWLRWGYLHSDHHLRQFRA